MRCFLGIRQNVDILLPPGLWELGNVLEGNDLLALYENIADIRKVVIKTEGDTNGNCIGVVGHLDDSHPL